MLIRNPDPPQASFDALRNGLDELARMGRLRSTDQRELTAAEVQFARPHLVHTIGLDDLQAGAGLSAAHPIAWRYLVEHDRDAIGLADVAYNAEGEHQLAQVNYGPFVAGTQQAFAQLEADQDNTAKPVAVLHIPALHVVALWIDPGEQDGRVVPLAPAPAGLESGHSYAAAEFSDLLTERARAIDLTADAQGS